MRRLMLLALFLMAVPVLAAEPAPSIFSTPSVTKVHPMPGMDYLYNQRGESTTILRSQSTPGLSWYSQEDRYGNIREQGYLYEPGRYDQPLTTEPLTPLPRHERDPYPFTR